MSAKKRQTFGKLQRERAQKEKRERKQEKKDDRKQAAADARDAELAEGTPEAQAADDENQPDAAGAPGASVESQTTDA